MNNYVVGIGASAGGLEALLKLLPSLQFTGKISYVIAQHMAHDGHSDLMVRLLNRVSNLQVVLVEDSINMEPDKIYMIPAGFDGVVEKKQLRVAVPLPENLSVPSVNRLLNSIAISNLNKGIGIILSGTGSDGAMGAQALKKHGGLVFVQHPDDADFNGMPSAVISKSEVDQILNLEEIPDALFASLHGVKRIEPLEKSATDLGKKPNPHLHQANPRPRTSMATAGKPIVPQPPKPKDANLLALLAKIVDRTGINFEGYKEETLKRRLNSRLAELRLSDITQYLSHVDQNPEELNLVAHWFLVSLSNFYRNSDSFDELYKELWDQFFKSDAAGTVKVWVPGCAMGEEVYTYAILLSELSEHAKRSIEFSVIGVDLNPAALQIALNGIYIESAFKEMKPVLREKYFTRTPKGYQIIDRIRDCCSFLQDDVINCQVPEKVDIVSCRNLLIYLHTETQDQLIRKFHQALKENGILMLGDSENLSIVGNTLFKPINHFHRLYRKRVVKI